MARRATETPVIPIKVPKFKSESEEADWWYDNRTLVEELLIEHGAWVGEHLEVEVELKPSKMISIRLPEADIARAKQVASRMGIGYQTFLRSLIHQALLRAPRGVKRGKTPVSRVPQS